MRVEAAVFVRRANSGRSRPPLVLGTLEGSELVEVWLKSPGLHESISPHAAAREWMAAKTASALGIPCAMPAIVNLSKDFLASLRDRELADSFAEAGDTAYGSLHLGDGWRRWSEASTFPRSRHQLMSAVYLFDCILENWDRRIANPNLLVQGSEFRVLDHEECFVSATGAELDRNSVQVPWKPGGVQNYFPGDMRHPFWSAVKRSNHVDFSEAALSWKELPEDTFSDYAGAAPEAWSKEACAAIAGYLMEARSRIDDVVEIIEGLRKQ